MPVFLPNGPNVPDHLVRLHEEGKVVFFCGAGISYPAGLPDFGGLVSKIYEKLATTSEDIEKEAINQWRYDQALDLLEQRLPGGRIRVRKALAESLEPNLRRKGAKGTHVALLMLATADDSTIRLVTTNFDRIFELSKVTLGIKRENFSAPNLPIPKKSRWDGIVYLHGLLSSNNPSDTDLHRLIVTSGDFGLAYLNERWASRFVSELLRGFTVCFVGYSIDDPVLRYMMDALAVDERLGEKRIEAFAFASIEESDCEKSRRVWKAKGVTPILYEKPGGPQDHSMLHLTIQRWAEIYHSGAGGKEMVISEYATSNPPDVSRSDPGVDQVCWALSDERAAKHFAQLKPVPPLSWLGPLCERGFSQNDLPSFGVREENPEEEPFSILQRPSPSRLSPWMGLVSSGGVSSAWDGRMQHMGEWMLRHLNNPMLAVWLAERGGVLFASFGMMIDGRIKEIERYEKEGNAEKLAKLRDGSPDAVPDPVMRILWRMFSLGRIKTRRYSRILGWFESAAKSGVTPSLRMEFFDLLTPFLSIKELYGAERFMRSEEEAGPRTVSGMVRWEIVLKADHVGAAVRDRRSWINWNEFLAKELERFSTLLRDALELRREVDPESTSRYTFSIEVPSISPHGQNRGFREWTILVSLARDAWLAVLETDAQRASRMAEEWWRLDHVIFKRLALFAATHESAVSASTAVGWLASEEGRWLWLLETQREVFRLLDSLGDRVDGDLQQSLEALILQGPPASDS